jgi:ABC-type bacteriocin/lantibiotic exporter with double-glycine peptidase domain
MAIFVSLITALPTLFVAGYFMFKNFHDPVRLSAFVVILPLLFNILSYTYQTLALVFRWRMHKSKLTAIYKTIQPSKDAPFTMIKKVKWPKISVIPNLIQGQTIAPPESISLPYPIQSHEELVRQASLAGRLTIRGENGCGKSTALLLIKDALAGKAFFLPTHNQLSFVAETNKYSTGESLKNRLLEILEKVEAEVLLLDEWDANLDPENKESLSVLIDELASKKCVIEVRHR